MGANGSDNLFPDREVHLFPVATFAAFKVEIDDGVLSTVFFHKGLVLANGKSVKVFGVRPNREKRF
jgi:hypothetical protein